MNRRTCSVLLAAMLCAVSITSAMPEEAIHAEDAYTLDVSVDVGGYRKPISPYLYGVNSDFRTEEYLYDATAVSARQGGNRFSGYNWENNFSNAGRDYQHYSDQYLIDFDKEQLNIPGSPALGFAREAAAKNVPYKITTIQMAGYVSADDDGAVSEDEIAPSARWIEVKPTKGSAFSLTPDQTDGYVYMDEYVNYLVETLGDASTATGYQAYNLDNEPSLWSATHARMHPDKVTCEEIVTKSIDYSAAIKAVDPKAEIFGLALYGVGAYYNFNSAPDWEEHADEYDWFVSYYLDEMRKAEETHGKRLVDVIDLHYYSEAKGQCRVTECEDYTHTDCIEARLQAPRSLYDTTYLETSWIADNFSDRLPILRTVNDSIDTYYPDTKLALTEYNFGGGNHISGAIAQADALGAFAANGVYVSNLWNVCSSMEYHLAAIDLYTNYDGNGAAFGNMLVSSATSDIEKAVSYAAIDGTDTSRVTLVLTNKSQTLQQNATIQLSSDAQYSSAKVYGITEESSDIQLMQTVDSITDNTFTIELPALSVVQIEITAEDYTMLGDVNTDGTVDDADVVKLTEAVLGKCTVPTANADLTADGIVDAFDLCMLKRYLHVWNTPVDEPYIVGFEPTKVGQFKIRNGMGGKTVTCLFTGEAGNGMRIGFGYWDPTAVNEETGKTGVWIHNDTTALGTYTFDENGEIYLTFTIPENALSVELMIYNYTSTDASGNVTQLDKAEIGLESITADRE